ncbi:MAG: hypothetical protein IV100_02335 [Myxococcales bacterium]|nr:hypothetical protein [Myxococcales bacterium]
MSEVHARGDFARPSPLTQAWLAEAARYRDEAPLGPTLLPGGSTRWATVQSEWEAFSLLPRGRRRELLEFVVSELHRNAARVSTSVVCAVTERGEWLVIDVIDHAGATTGARLDAALTRARGERRARDTDEGMVDSGAGIGLFLIEKRSALFTLRVAPGRFTRATAALWLGLPADCPTGIGQGAAFVIEE